MNTLRRVHATRDSGMTLTELIVAMGIFMAVLAVFMAAVVSMSQTTVRAQVTSDTTTEMRTVFQRLDKELRYASDINVPGTSAGDVYVEYLVPSSTANADPLCVQWRLKTNDREFQRRTWEPGNPGSASGWMTMITDVRNDLSQTSQQPFRFHPAGTTDGKIFLRQRLDVYLDAGLGEARDGQGSQLDVTFVALNSTSHSVTNSGGNTVCLGGGIDRP